MAKVNELLSIESLGTGLQYTNDGTLHKRYNILATVKNGNKRGKLLIQTKVPHTRLNFKVFGQYVTRLYEMFLLFGGDVDKAYAWAEENTRSPEDFMKLFHLSIEYTNTLERVYGDKLGYFIFNFCDPKLNSYGYTFYDLDDKKTTLIGLMRARLQ